jgi:hypothetical protein
MLEPSHARTPEDLDDEVRRILRGRTRRSFLIGGAAALAGAGAYEALYRAKMIDGLQWPLREAHEANRTLIDGIFRQRVLAPTYPASAETGLRINGDFGIDRGLIQSSWGLQLVGLDRPERYPQFMPDVDLWEYRSKDDYESQKETSTEPDVKRKAPDVALKEEKHASVREIPHLQESTGVTASADAVPGVVLRLEDLRKLPYTEQITQFKCVEGWSQIVRWGGVRFSDVLRAYPPANIDGGPPKFATMETSNGEYNASFDMASLMHPQTLLCYSMAGRPLEPLHGAPLRLAMPLKYGYKQIKGTASITFGNVRVSDYWEKLGYDWYAGL